MHPRLATRPLLWPGAVLLVATAILLIGLSPAGAQPAGKPNPQPSLKIDISSAKASLESETKTGPHKHKLEVELDNRSHTFKVEYEAKDPGAEVEADVKVRLTELVEWRDVNGNGVYDPGVRGETVQRIKLTDLRSASVQREDAALGGMRLVGVSAALDRYTELLVTLTLSVPRELPQAGVTGTPMGSPLMGFRIVGFPYQARDTSLALGVRLEREVEEDVNGKGRGKGATLASAGRYDALFGWADTATVDGRTAAVRTTAANAPAKRGDDDDDDRGKRKGGNGSKPETKMDGDLYLLYPRGTAIFHEAR